MTRCPVVQRQSCGSPTRGGTMRGPFRVCGVAAILAGVVGACGGDGGGGTGPAVPTITSFTATPASLAFGGGTVTLSWQVTGATSLSISPGVGAVTPATNGSKDVAVTTTTTFTLTATNTTGSATAPAAVTVATGITVNGLVKDFSGEPISGAAVLVAGKSPVTSGSDGKFSVSNVSPPYDITLILSTQKTAVVYKGLTRTDPTLLYLDFTGAAKTAVINGTVPVAAGKVTAVLFVSGTVGGLDVADPTTGAYSMTVYWYGAAAAKTGQLYVLRWTPGAGPAFLPTSYDGYGNKAQTISAGGTFTQDFAPGELNDPPEQSIGGTVTVPANYTLSDRELVFMFGSLPVFIAQETGTLSNTFTYNVPNVSGLQLTFGVYAEAAGSSRVTSFFRTGISGGATNVSVPLETAPQLALPVNAATGVDATTAFTWSQGTGTGVNVFDVFPISSSNPRFFVFTTTADAKIPDLSAQGMGLPASASYRWQVERYMPVASTDAAAGSGFLPLVFYEAGDVGYTESEQFTFTSKAAAGASLQGTAAGPTVDAARAVGERVRARRLRVPSH